MRPFFLILVTALAVTAQVDQSFRFRTAATEQDYKDLSVAALTMSGLQAKAVDIPLRELSISGTADQVRVAEWVISELDRPVAPTPPPSAVFTLQTKEPENTMRVFYPSSVSTDQAFAEIATALRTITDIRYVTPYTSHRALALRGNAEQIEFSEWMLAEMNREAPQQTYVYPKSGREKEQGENLARMFRFTRAKDVQQFNEVQTMIRTLTDIRRVYPYINRRVIALRGSQEQLDMTQWLLAQLEKDFPVAQKSASSDFPLKNGEVMRLFHFPAGMTDKEFSDASTALRMATGIRRVFPFVSARTIGVRGTAVQIAQAAAIAGQ